MIFYLLLAISLLYFSFPNYFHPFGFWPFAWVFAVPLFFALEGQSLKRRLFWGAFFGLFFYALLVQWLIPYSVVGYILFVLVLAIQPAIFFGLYESQGRRREIL